MSSTNRIAGGQPHIEDTAHVHNIKLFVNSGRLHTYYIIRVNNKYFIQAELLLSSRYIRGMSAPLVVRSAQDLISVGVPAPLCGEAWRKITEEIFDAGNYVVFGLRNDDDKDCADLNDINDEQDDLSDETSEYVQDIETSLGNEVSASSMYSLHASVNIESCNTVFLIDHLW